MQAICVSDTHVSFLVHPQGWPQQHSLQAFFLFFLFFQQIKKNIVMAEKSISCLRVLGIGERRRGGGGGGGVQGVGNGSGIMLHEISSAASSMKPNPLLG